MRACLLLVITASYAQTPPRHTLEGSPRPDLYTCERCRAIYEHSFDALTARTTLPPPVEPDGEAGRHPAREEATGRAKRHGYLRGWVKTDAEGLFEITTIRPGGYPGGSEPAHIRMVVKEPGRAEYGIDGVAFEPAPSRTAARRAARAARASSRSSRTPRACATACGRASA